MYIKTDHHSVVTCSLSIYFATKLKTYRHLSTRIVGLKGISFRIGQTLLNSPNSRIHDRALQADHDNITNCFFFIHKSELDFIDIPKSLLMKRFNSNSNNQAAPTS